MTIKAEQVGRRLVLTVTDENDVPVFEPYVVEPVAMVTGRQLTQDFIDIATMKGTVSKEREAEIFRIALNEDNTVRAEHEATQVEGNELALKAFMWQTVVGMDGIQAYDNAGGGVAGAVKAIRLLTMMSAALPSQTSPLLESVNQMRTAATPGTSTPQGGGSTVDRLPPARRSIRQGKPRSAA